MRLKKITLLFLLFSASLLSNSLAGRKCKNAATVDQVVGATYEEQEEDVGIIQERLLREVQKDYGRTNPSPRLVKPPFKLIPN